MKKPSHISKKVAHEAGQALSDPKATKRERSEAGEILRMVQDQKPKK